MIDLHAVLLYRRIPKNDTAQWGNRYLFFAYAAFYGEVLGVDHDLGAAAVGAACVPPVNAVPGI